jgi:hypothetical protein
LKYIEKIMKYFERLKKAASEKKYFDKLKKLSSEKKYFERIKKFAFEMSVKISRILPAKAAEKLPEKVLCHSFEIAGGIVILLAVLILTVSGGSKNENISSGAGVASAEGGRSLEALLTEKCSETAARMKENSISDPEEETYTVTLCAVGDNIMHSVINDKAYSGGGMYDYHFLYENVKDVISSYDIAVVNQETVFVDDPDEYSGFPYFGTPTSVGDALVDTGFDVILHATNHVWDKEEYGIFDTINYWKEEHPEISILGIHEDEEDYERIDTIERNNITFALLDYTYDMNGFPLPDDEYYLVNTLQYADGKLLRDISNVEEDVDMTVCFLHCGDEYEFIPTDAQMSIVESVIDAGADIVICSHPHVVEPYKKVVTEEGNSGIVYYSCGNFVSAQTTMARVLGGMASITVKKTVSDDKSETTVEDFDFIPMVTHYTDTEHEIYFLEDYTEELASKHLITYEDDSFSKENLWAVWNDVVNAEIM